MYMWRNIFHIIITWQRDILKIFCPCHQNIPKNPFLIISSCSHSHIHMFSL
jgi:hypothetical protein